MSQQFNYPATDAGVSPLPVTGTVTADQGAPNTAANGWPVKVTDGTDTLAITAAGEANVVVASSALPTGAATETTLAAFSAKTAAALVPQAYDYQAITYVGATTDISTVVYKTGGSGGTTVATLTMGYDGSNRLTSVTRS